jgi:hypothetical protein
MGVARKSFVAVGGNYKGRRDVGWLTS